MVQKKKKGEKTLEERVGETRVYVLSEVGYDTVFFNPAAYDTLLDFMSQDQNLSGIVIDGAVTRLDRPEYLNDKLSYWTNSEEECFEETDKISNRRQYKHMMEVQLQILEERLKEAVDRKQGRRLVE